MQEKSEWICCPVCGSKTRTKVYPGTIMTHFPLFCPKCRRKYRIDVIKPRMTLSN
ncbi:MAG: cysteine-rich KTR domain-containing protein [Oxalobacter formigenes]|nr:cysteine-rich KTR domain-containing protein [Oxalobacter formigenes]